MQPRLPLYPRAVHWVPLIATGVTSAASPAAHTVASESASSSTSRPATVAPTSALQSAVPVAAPSTAAAAAAASPPSAVQPSPPTPLHSQHPQHEDTASLPEPSTSQWPPVVASPFTLSSSAVVPVVPGACRNCSSPGLLLPGCIHARCASCCKLLFVHCPAHDSRQSLVGARFAAVLDGSVNGGLRLTAQLGDRIYRGVLFTGPTAVRMHRTSIAADTGSSAASTAFESTNGDTETQPQAAKRHQPAPSSSAASSGASSINSHGPATT